MPLRSHNGAELRIVRRNRRFKASRAKEIIAGVLKARLSGQQYHADNTSSWAREIADEIKSKLKGVTRPSRSRSGQTAPPAS